MWERSALHLREAGEGYWEHMRFAATVAAMLSVAGLACFIHALVPGLCTRTASTSVSRLQRLFADRSALTAIRQEASGGLVFLLLLLLAFGAVVLLLSVGSRPLVAGAVGALALGFPAMLLMQNPELDALN